MLPFASIYVNPTSYVRPFVIVALLYHIPMATFLLFYHFQFPYGCQVVQTIQIWMLGAFSLHCTALFLTLVEIPLIALSPVMHPPKSLKYLLGVSHCVHLLIFLWGCYGISVLPEVQDCVNRGEATQSDGSAIEGLVLWDIVLAFVTTMIWCCVATACWRRRGGQEELSSATASRCRCIFRISTCSRSSPHADMWQKLGDIVTEQLAEEVSPGVYQWPDWDLMRMGLSLVSRKQKREMRNFSSKEYFAGQTARQQYEPATTKTNNPSMNQISAGRTQSTGGTDSNPEPAGMQPKLDLRVKGQQDETGAFVGTPYEFDEDDLANDTLRMSTAERVKLLKDEEEAQQMSDPCPENANCGVPAAAGSSPLQGGSAASNNKSKQSRRQRVSRANVAGFQGVMPDLQVLAEAERHMRLATAMYGWMFYVFIHPLRLDTLLLAPLKRSKQERDRVHYTGLMGLDYACFMKHAELHEEDLLYFTYRNELHRSPYAMVKDEVNQQLIIVFRGSLSTVDFIVDGLASATVAEENITAVSGETVTHAGILQAATTLFAELNSGEQRRIIDRYLCEREDWELIITGHSLGAGLATLVTLMFKKEFANTRGFCFAPPALLDEASARWAKCCVNTFVYRFDMVPRMSQRNVARLCAEILQAQRKFSSRPLYSYWTGAVGASPYSTPRSFSSENGEGRPQSVSSDDSGCGGFTSPTSPSLQAAELAAGVCDACTGVHSAVQKEALSSMEALEQGSWPAETRTPVSGSPSIVRDRQGGIFKCDEEGYYQDLGSDSSLVSFYSLESALESSSDSYLTLRPPSVRSSQRAKEFARRLGNKPSKFPNLLLGGNVIHFSRIRRHARDDTDTDLEQEQGYLREHGYGRERARLINLCRKHPPNYGFCLRDPSFFGRIFVTAKMVFDHMPVHYEAGLGEISRWAKQELQEQHIAGLHYRGKTEEEGIDPDVVQSANEGYGQVPRPREETAI